MRRPTRCRRRVVPLAVGLAVLAAVPPALEAGPESTRLVRIYAPRNGPGPGCDRVLPLERRVVAPRVLTGALSALLAGPTAAERARGYEGWFSARTRGRLRRVSIRSGVAYVDLADLRRVIPGASSSCGSAMLLNQLDRTALQFPTVRRVLYSLDGSRRDFYEWLQRSAPAR